MDEVLDFCVRVLGPVAAANTAAGDARATEAAERTELLAAAARACRARADHVEAPDATSAPTSLAAAVAVEMADATSRLPERHREALALREALRLSHGQIAQAMGIEPAAVAPLLGRARLQLRAERRGGAIDASGPPCGERERAWRLLALRQDSEPLGADDDAWLYGHLDGCEGCRRAHAAMLEASACYRAWRISERPGGGLETVATQTTS